MSGIRIRVENDQEKEKLIADYLARDEEYLKALEALKQDLARQGVDLASREGRKKFIVAVRELNSRFGTDIHRDFP